MKIKYQDWNPRGASLGLVMMAEEIINDMASQGYTLTLRQLYYKFVSKALIPNTERSYKNLGSLITKARMAGLISWDAIEDRNRTHNMPWVKEDPEELLRDLPRYISFDLWKNQPYYIEVWVEKEALGNVIEKACNPYRVPFMSCKGYLSASEAWRAGRRFLRQIDNGKECMLIHLGDHDPSGIDMTRDNRDRLDVFSEFPGEVQVKRVALNMDQIEQYKPPPNPAKTTDSRATGYIKRFGEISWELDALEPRVIHGLIKDAIEPVIDFDIWNDTFDEEREVSESLGKLYLHWDAVRDYLTTLDDDTEA